MKLIKISAIWCPSCLIMEKIWQDLQEEFTKRSKSSKVIIVNKSTEITL